MKTRALAIGLACSTTLLVGAASAAAATRCVGSGHGCHRTIQAALDASHDGDTIRVAPGTFAGGVEVTKSVKLVGAGAGATTIRGGGPVVTVGTLEGDDQPSVTIAGVKIAGGRTTSGLGGEPFFADGGGILVMPAAEGAERAALKLRDSVVSGNRSTPAETIVPDDDGPQCPGGRCPFAQGEGGGISSFGDLDVADSVVTDNEAGGPVASDAKGGGIYSAIGALRLDGVRLVRNRTVVSAPNGRFAEGGGLLVEHDSVSATIRDTLFGDNAADLTSDLPAFAGDELIDVQSHAGGALIADRVPTTIERSIFTGNSAGARNPHGEPIGYTSALHILDTPATIRDVLITGNRSTAVLATTEDVGPMGGALELDGGGTLTNVHVVGNSSSVSARDGLAAVVGALEVADFDGHPDQARVLDSTISGNTALASSQTGEAIVHGPGVWNNSLLELRRTVVSLNAGRASAPNGSAQGGGIWNGVDLTGPPVELTLADSLITGNVLLGGRGIEREGGGLFTTFPVTRKRTPIVGNLPDQCSGCGLQATAARARSAARVGARPRARG